MLDSSEHHLMKVVIDLRPPRPAWQTRHFSPPTNVKNENSEIKFPPSPHYKEGERFLDFPPLLRKPDRESGSSKDPTSWSWDESPEEYFGGPIFDKSTSTWRETFHTRSNGDVVGARENKISLPSNIDTVIRSVGVMKRRSITQSGMWVSPRLLISSLDFHGWITGDPSQIECERARDLGISFAVENEISEKLLSEYSPRVQLVAFDVENEFGIFKLQDQYADRKDFIDIRWMLEYDEACSQQNLNLEPGTNAACVGYSAIISEDDSKTVLDQANRQLWHLPISHNVSTNLNHTIKPATKIFAPGTLDQADKCRSTIRYGISASVWKGANGGPCIILEGAMAGVIVGIVRRADLSSNPYNSVNGFPAGIRDAIKGLL